MRTVRSTANAADAITINSSAAHDLPDEHNLQLLYQAMAETQCTFECALRGEAGVYTPGVSSASKGWRAW
eukprot:2556281-Amphidinium_carterae.1